MSVAEKIHELGFTDAQTAILLRYKTPYEDPLFANAYNYYQLTYLLETLTNEQVMQYLASIASDDNIVDEKVFYFQSPQYSGVRDATEKELYLLQDEEQFASKDSRPCKWCGSTQTITQFKQLRRADEGATEVTECLACKKRQ